MRLRGARSEPVRNMSNLAHTHVQSECRVVESHVRMFLVRVKFQKTGYDVALQVSASLKVQSLNREWTRIHANKYNKFREAADGIRIGTPVPISSGSCCPSNSLLRFFPIRVNSRLRRNLRREPVLLYPFSIVTRDAVIRGPRIEKHSFLSTFALSAGSLHN